MCHHGHVFSSSVPGDHVLSGGTFSSYNARVGEEAEDDVGNLGCLRGWDRVVVSGWCFPGWASEIMCHGICLAYHPRGGGSDEEKQELQVSRNGIGFALCFLHSLA